MKILTIVSTATLALSVLPVAANASDSGLLTMMRVGASIGVCRDKVKAAYGVGPRKSLAVEQFKIDAHPDTSGDRLVRYTGFTQDKGQPRVAIAGVCHVRRDGPSTIEIGKPQ
jgi:hypothetical protein